MFFLVRVRTNPLSFSFVAFNSFCTGGDFIFVGFDLDMPLGWEHSINCTYIPHVCHVIIYLPFSWPGSQSTNFATRIRNCDHRCCITGREIFGDNFTGFEAAHIFPLGQTDEVGRTSRSVYVHHNKSVVEPKKYATFHSGSPCSWKWQDELNSERVSLSCHRA